MRSDPHCAHTTGRCAPHPGHCSTEPVDSTARPQTVQRTSAPQLAHAGAQREEQLSDAVRLALAAQIADEA
ncbi:MAG: hypothetical protein ACP5PM_08240, partial [Acidimicrobiales bacterium]